MARQGETKRTYRDELDETLREGIPPEFQKLLDKLR
jgi:hypothetical protein